MRMRTRGGGIATLLLFALALPVRADERVAANLVDMTLEQLGNVVVTSVSRRSEKLSDAAASIYVITADDIRRSGATTLPQALRLAPNLQVARADANQWAISARGFNSVLANKMLVLIDGRTVYSPLFSGTFWEVQDLLMVDVERIEVVSGPGGTMWGTNAVNGVINVITKSAAETHGSIAGFGGGNVAFAGALRSGGAVGNGWHARGWFKAVGFEDSERGDRSEIEDGSQRNLVGLRFDRDTGDNAYTIEAGGYDIAVDQLPAERDLDGYHLLGRWSRQPEQGSTFNVQAYYDRTNRDQPASLVDKLDTYDFEFQHGFRMFAHQEVLWGAGYRYQWDAVRNLGPGFVFMPDDRAIRTAHVFVEDGIRLADAWKLELGVKAESNEYTGLEWLPTIRLSVKPAARHLLWSAVSRAVRAPSRIDRDFFSPAAPPHFILDGGPDFVSEVSDVAEVGYRGQLVNDFSLSLTAFIHEHDGLRSLEPTPSGPQWQNRIHGTSRGLEGWLRWRPMRTCEISAGGVAQDIDLALDPGSNDVGGLAALGNDPEFWYGIRASVDPSEQLEFSADFRRVGALPRPYVPAYNSANARVGWWLKPQLQLSVTGRNLLERSHPEWGVDPVRAEVARSYFVGLAWRSR
jgi:iron complex outermembrane receptor protein